MVEDNAETDRELEVMEEYVESLLEEIKTLKTRNSILQDRMRAYEEAIDDLFDRTLRIAR